MPFWHDSATGSHSVLSYNTQPHSWALNRYRSLVSCYAMMHTILNASLQKPLTTRPSRLPPAPHPDAVAAEALVNERGEENRLL